MEFGCPVLLKIFGEVRKPKDPPVPHRPQSKASRKISKLEAISIKLSLLTSANFVKHWSYSFNFPVEVFR
jgi:hypothetical protein